MNKKQQALFIQGSEVRIRLLADRQNHSNRVHVDWLRATFQVRNAPVPTVETLFPEPVKNDDFSTYSEHELDTQRWARAKLAKLLRSLPDADFAVSAQAHVLAGKVCKILGPEFSIEPELKKGMDFYRFRWSITRNGSECAWVGFLASGDSPRQKAQMATMHVNVYGAACTFARGDWRHRMAHLLEQCEARITRCDLALDFFDGIKGGLDRIKHEWENGFMDHHGQRPKPNTVGPWVEGGRGRSFYFGSKEAGKQTNVYEKGVQLFGEKDATNWERIELRYGDKLRELPADMLRRPDDFFAGASDWHSFMLAEHGKTVEAAPIKVKAKQAVESVKAEVTRAIRWLNDTAAQSLALAFQYCDEQEFLNLVRHRNLPGRLRKFAGSEIKAAFAALSPKLYQPRVAMA